MSNTPTVMVSFAAESHSASHPRAESLTGEQKSPPKLNKKKKTKTGSFMTFLSSLNHNTPCSGLLLPLPNASLTLFHIGSHRFLSHLTNDTRKQYGPAYGLIFPVAAATAPTPAKTPNILAHQHPVL